ncbi:MAG: hypothetical protein Q7S44_02675 [bacterium]|nr:hypothetical protein [bacterium]
MKKFRIDKEGGFTVLEVVIAAALFVLFAVASIGVVVQGYNANRLGAEYTVASQFASEGLEAVKSIKNQQFSLLDSSAYTSGTGLIRNGSEVWQFEGNNTSDILLHNSQNNYTRVIKMEDAQRDGSGNIVASGTPDPDTKKITSTVSWNFNSARPESVSLATYLSDWRKALAGSSPPTVTTSAATNVTPTSATLNGLANPNGSLSTGWFRYDTTDPGTCNDTFGTRAPLSGGTDLGSGTSDVNYSQDITSLSASTTYYFCAIASNSQGTNSGNVMSFNTGAPPSIEYIGSVSSSGNNTTSSNFTLPAGWNPGDVAVFWWYTYNNTKTITPPGAITQTQQTSSAGFGRIYIAYRVLQAGDSAFAWTSSSSSNSTTIWGTSVFSGVNTSADPFEAQSGAPITFTGVNPDPPAVTTLSNNVMVVPIFGKIDNYTSITPPASYTTAGSNSSTAGNDASAGAAYFKKASAGAEDPGAWTLGNGGASAPAGYIWTGALKPN